MKSLRNLVLIIALSVGLNPSSYGRHIIGGELYYECLGIDTIRGEATFRFTCTVYRDCFGGGADFDNVFNFGIYRQTASGWEVYEVRQISLTDTEFIEPENDNPCIIVPPNVCVESGTYVFSRTLPFHSANYMVAFQRCCRNNTITNIFDPGDQGAAYTIEITPEAQVSCNNSPKFRSFPPIVICADQPLDFDHGADDEEGDDLVYQLCAPLTAGGQLGSTAQNPCPPGSCDCVIPDPNNCLPPFRRINFRVPAYTSTRPIPGAPPVAIDRVTGRLTGTPNEIGQFVVGVCVDEFRNGVLLTTFRRDFQFNVTVCEQGVLASLENDGLTSDEQFLINSCGDNTVEFVNQSTREEFIEEYMWLFNVNGETDTVFTQDASYTFPGIGQYTGMMVLNRSVNFASCKDTAFFTVNVFPEINADFTYDYDTCVAGPVNFTDLSVSGSDTIVDWQWDFDDPGGFSSIPNPNYTYSTPGNKNVVLSVTDINDCQDDIELDIPYFPVPPVIIVEPSSFVGCAPAEITFVNLSTPIDESYDVQWDFGSGGMTTGISPTYEFTEPGTYTVKVEITSPLGCETEAEFDALIRVEPSPIANFTFSPTELTNFENTVDFTDLSIGAGSWQWTFENEGVLFDQNPTYTFQDTGVHKVELVVVHPSGCTDTLCKFLDVVPISTYYLPNAFTPNRDGNNDDFEGVGYFEGMSEFSLTVWNRWGEMVFETTDPKEGWNGRKLNEGENSPEGVYVYKVEYRGPRGNKTSNRGYVTLIR